MLSHYLRHQKSRLAILFLALGFLWVQNYVVTHDLAHQLESHEHQQIAQFCEICTIAKSDNDGFIFTALIDFDKQVVLFFQSMLWIIFVVSTFHYFRPNPRAPPVFSS